VRRAAGAGAPDPVDIRIDPVAGRTLDEGSAERSMAQP
jgi:hypothetical protein